MVVKESIVNVGIMGGTYWNPHCGCHIEPGLLMTDPDAKYGLRDDTVVAALSTNVEV